MSRETLASDPGKKLTRLVEAPKLIESDRPHVRASKQVSEGSRYQQPLADDTADRLDSAY